MERDVKILIVDESEEFRKSCADNLSGFGYRKIEQAADGEEAMFIIESKHPDIVIIDMWVAKIETINVMRNMSQIDFGQDMSPSFIVLSLTNSQNLFCEMMDEGAEYCIMKPIDYNSLTSRLKRIEEKRSMKNRYGTILTAPNVKPNEKIEDHDLETQVTKVFHNIGIPAHIKGYQYLRTAILMSIKNTDLINSVTKALYPSVARQYSTTSSRVERAIRHAIEVAWDRGDVDTLDSYFGYTIHNNRGKPTNSEFIAMIADNLRLSNKLS